MKKIEILWTGGWDSTYRLVELSRQNYEVQPYYIIDKNRKSINHELKSMNNILELLRNKKETKAKLNDLITVEMDSIPKNEEISNTYKEIYNKIYLGSQYEWLARFALNHKNIELCVEKGEKSACLKVINEYGKLKFIDEIGYLDTKKSSKEVELLFGNISFPIINKSETDMAKNIKEWGYEDVMKNIWFCHLPIKGKCCGMCHPCEQKIEQHMDFLLSKKALRNYKIKKLLNKVFGNKLTSKFVNLYRKLNKTNNQ